MIEYDAVTASPDDGLEHLAVPVDRNDVSTLCGQKADKYIGPAQNSLGRLCPGCATARRHLGIVSGAAT